MTKFELSLLYLAPAAMLVIATSLVVGCARVVGRRWVTRLAPGAQERVVTFAVWAPSAAGVLFLLVGLADIWLVAGPSSACLGSELMGTNRSNLLLIALGVLLVRVAAAGLRLVLDLRLSRRVTRTLRWLASCSPAHFHLVPTGEPQAFVVGLLSPQVYLSQGLIEAVSRDDLAVVLAHEQAHLSRRDPLRRLAAGIGLLFHLPGIQHLLAEDLARAQEMVVDAAAAEAVGERLRVAEALVRVGRLRCGRAEAAVEFIDGHLEARVRELLDPRPRLAGPSTNALLAAAAVLAVLCMFAVHPLHLLSRMFRLP